MRNFLATTALVGTLVSVPVIAQDSGTNTDSGISEIIVTAQRRDENLQKSALAVSVLGGDDLTRAGVNQAQDLSRLVPALKLSAAGGGGTQITIRGIGSFVGNPFAEPGVAINLDGVYLPRSSGPTGLYYDLERVEVLKGPQGTLYGRNATAGAVNIITRKPKEEWQLRANLDAGNYGKMRGELAINVPIKGVGGLRIAGVVSRQDGYFKDGYGSDETDAVRAQFNYDQGGPFTLLLSADYAHVGGNGVGGVFAVSETGFISDDPRLGATLDGSNAILQNVSNQISGGANPNLLPRFKTDGFIDVTNWGISATASYDLGNAALTVTPAYRENENHYLHYNAGYPVGADEFSKATSLEARLASTDKSAALQWLIGGFYFDEDLNFELRPYQGVAYGVTRPILNTRSYAAFGQLSYAIVDALRVTGGLRYTDEKKTMDGELGFQNPARGPGFPVTFLPLTGRISDSSLTWKAGVEFDAGPASLIYTSVATGFKAGGFFASQPPNTAKPEKLIAYTVGTKNRFFSNSLQINAEAFLWKYRDKQVTHIGPIQPFGFNLITENAGRAQVYGIEADIIWQPSPYDRLSANAQYLQSEYKDFIYTQSTVTGPAQTACAISPLSATSVSVDCSGRELPRAPKWTLNLAYLHSFDVGTGHLDALVGTRIESRSVIGEEYLAGQYQKGYMLSNASLTWRGSEDRYSVSVYIDNIEDEVVKTSSFVQPVVGLPVVTLAAPRTYGVRLGFDF